MVHSAGDHRARSTNCSTPAAFEDLGPNGLQVPGAAEVARVVTGVTAQRALAERAVAEGAQLVLVHHGLFWSFDPPGLTPILAERLRPLFKHDIGLAAYHLPLDAHPEMGNNALLAEALGATEHVAFGDVGRGATFAEPVPAAELFARVRAGDRARAARLRRRAAGRAAPRDRLGRRRLAAAGRHRGGLRRLPDGRAEGARDGRRVRGRDPLRRRGPLRHGDRRAAERRAESPGCRRLRPRRLPSGAAIRRWCRSTSMSRRA